MNWTKFFDGIYLINLPHRTKRFMDSADELERYDIPFEKVEAIQLKKGQTGLWKTMKFLFENCIEEEKSRILVFEDDIEFVENPNNYMPDIIRQLDGRKWDMLNLGPNTHEPFEKFEGQNLLRMQKCRGLHAVAYNLDAMCFFIEMEILPNRHLDEYFEEFLQTEGNCYCTYPLLATQRPDHSDIANKYQDQSYIVERFKRHTAFLEPFQK